MKSIMLDGLILPWYNKGLCIIIYCKVLIRKGSLGMGFSTLFSRVTIHHSFVTYLFLDKRFILCLAIFFLDILFPLCMSWQVHSSLYINPVHLLRCVSVPSRFDKNGKVTDASLAWHGKGPLAPL